MNRTKLDEKGVVVTCRSCGQRNRIAYARLSDETRCGQCKSALQMPDEPIDLQSEGEFYTLTNNSGLPVLIDFWAPWCAPCRAVAPELARVASANAGSFLVAKANTQDLPSIANAFQVMSIPALAVFYHGRVIGRTQGARPAAEIQKFVQQSLASTGP
jgi:thioredoxin 2